MLALLAAGRWLLVAGCQLLAAVCWLLALLAAGRWLLAAATLEMPWKLGLGS
jgi:hypothetical protein